MKQKPKKGGAPNANKNALKLRAPEIRQQAYREFCGHISNGRSPRSFTFEHPDFTVTGQTIERMIRDTVEFPSIHKQVAEAKGFGYWERILEESAIGKNKRINVASLQIIMRNKFGWDKQDKRSQEVDKAALDSYSDFFTRVRLARNSD